MSGPTLDGNYWTRLCGRILYVLKFVAFFPMILVLFVAAFPWWLITGNSIPIPKWMDRMYDAHGY